MAKAAGGPSFPQVAKFPAALITRERDLSLPAGQRPFFLANSPSVTSALRRITRLGQAWGHRPGRGPGINDMLTGTKRRPGMLCKFRFLQAQFGL